MGSDSRFVRRSLSRMCAGFALSWLAIFGVLLSGCGGSNSVAGTSASNCLASLSGAIATQPSDSAFLGMREISKEAAKRIARLERYDASAPLCVIGFRLENGPKKVELLEIYALATSKKLGTFYTYRSSFDLAHPF